MTDKDFIKSALTTIRLLWMDWPDTMIDELVERIENTMRREYNRWHTDGMLEEMERQNRNDIVSLQFNLKQLLANGNNSKKSNRIRQLKKKASNRSGTKSKPVWRPRKPVAWPIDMISGWMEPTFEG